MGRVLYGAKRDMIDYIQVYEKDTFKLVGIVDIFKSVIWHTQYYGVGDFEIYTTATEEHIELLKLDRWIVPSNTDRVAIIEKIQTTYTAQDGYMLIVTGRMAHSILDRRLIYHRTGNRCYPVLVSGNVQNAINLLINFCMINPSNTRRKYSGLSTAIESSPKQEQFIVDENGERTERQVTYDNLLTYVLGLLEEYNLGAYSKIVNNKIQFTQYAGEDLPHVFSVEFDNLVSSEYTQDKTSVKNVALISGAETQDTEGNTVKPQTTLLYDSQYSGLDRRELYIDGSSVDAYKEETTEEGDRIKYDETTYQNMLQGLGMTTLAGYKFIPTLSGQINVSNALLKFGIDYKLGDTVLIEDVRMKVYTRSRILEVTEVQDENGYNIDLVYGG